MFNLFVFLLLLVCCANADVTKNTHEDKVCKTQLQTYYMYKLYEITLCRNKNVVYDEIFKSNFSIKLKYKMSSSSWWLANRSFAEIAKQNNLTNEEKKAYKNILSGFFPNVNNGDEILLEFEPSVGATFYYNNKMFDTIADVGFAVKFANIWLSPNSTFIETRNLLFAND